MFVKLQQYVGDGDGFDLSSTGPIMCSISIIVWVLTICKEFYDISLMLRALTAVQPRHEDLTNCRRAVSIAVQGLRCVIAGLLAWYGCLFLVYTLSVEELLLNTVALEFVITVDELMFGSLAPLAAQVACDAIIPIISYYYAIFYKRYSSSP